MIRITIAQLEAFTGVVEHGGITGASEAMGWSKSKVSKLLSELEDHLDVQLFYRSTRTMRLTSEGRGFYEDTKKNLTSIADSIIRSQGAKTELRGHIRVSAPVAFTRTILNPALKDLSLENVTLDLSLSDERDDLEFREHDLYVRVGNLPDGDYYAKKVGETEIIFVASPSFVAQHGGDLTLSDLAHLPLLRYAQHGKPIPWAMADQDLELNPTPKLVSNNGDYLLDAAVAGMGLTKMPDFMAAKHLASGELVQLFADQPRTLMPISVLYFERMRQTKLLNHFIDLVSGQIGRMCRGGCTKVGAHLVAV